MMPDLKTVKPVEGTTCNVDLDPYQEDPTPCGKPAVISWRYTDDPDGALNMCESCRIQRLRHEAVRDQDAAFEEEFGYPAKLDFAGIAMNLGLQLERFRELEERAAPPLILGNLARLINRRRKWVRQWLRKHPPNKKYGTQLAAVDFVISSVDRSNPRAETLLLGLAAARAIARDVDAERS